MSLSDQAGESSPLTTYFTTNSLKESETTDEEDENSDTYNDSTNYNYNEENENDDTYNDDSNTNNNVRLRKPPLTKLSSKNYYLPANIHVLRVENLTESRNFSCQAQNSFGLVVFNLTVVIKGKIFF